MNKISAIIHVDGDGFFAACEVAQNERLRGKPVVTGQEKGMAIAMTYEAKARGASRGMLMSEIRKLIPDVIVMPGNYDLYKICSKRMVTIVRRYAHVVEEYSIDECFAEISGKVWENLVEVAHRIQHDLEKDLGMTFSLGLGPTKTLAKVASKWKKPAGFTAMQHPDIKKFLSEVPIGAVWGIGRSLSAYFQKKNILTALDFAEKSQNWIEENLAKPSQELWYELNGIMMHHVHNGHHEKHQSLRATRTFKPVTQNKQILLSELAKNTEKACMKLRKHHLKAKTLYFYLKTQTFRYFGKEIVFTAPLATPQEMLNAISKEFDGVFKKGYDYRATGVVLHSIRDDRVYQPDLFNLQQESNDHITMYKTVDQLWHKWGRGSIFLAASLHSRLRGKKEPTQEMKINDICLRLGIPYWGEVK